MIIKLLGKYKIIEPFTAANDRGMPFQVRRGEIRITEINENKQQVYSPEIGFWVGWDLPVEMKGAKKCS